MISRARLTLGVAAVLLGAAAAPSFPATTVVAANWSISLTASASSTAVGNTVTLTATVNQNVGSSGYYIDVDDETTRSPVDYCSSGKSCQVPVTWAGAGAHTFVAFVDGDPSFEYPPCCVQATSNTVTVTWGQAITWSVSLSASSSDAAVGSPVTLTATANANLTGTGDTIAIFDETTGESIGECSTDTSCPYPVTESAGGTHSFVAFVDADPVLEYPPCCIQAQSNTVEVTWHAQATAGMTVTFQAGGTLPTFPCPNGCTTTFSGWGVGSGSAQARTGSEEYAASFVMPSAEVTGSVTYTEPGSPFCPADGSATGQVTITGAATGSVQRTSTPAETGTVNAIDFQLNFTYQRIGATTVVTITGGTAAIHFTFPDTGPDYFMSNVAGAGTGVFAVGPTDAIVGLTRFGGHADYAA